MAQGWPLAFTGLHIQAYLGLISMIARVPSQTLVGTTVGYFAVEEMSGVIPPLYVSLRWVAPNLQIRTPLSTFFFCSTLGPWCLGINTAYWRSTFSQPYTIQ